MDFNEKLLFLRKEHNMTQEDLAKELGVTRQAVQKWETGSSFPKMDKLQRISELFNYSLNDLIGLDDILLNRKEIYQDKKGTHILVILNILLIIPTLFFTVKNEYPPICFLLCTLLPALISYITFHHIHYFLYFGDSSNLFIEIPSDYDVSKLKNNYYSFLFYQLLFLFITIVLSLVYFIFKDFKDSYYFYSYLYLILFSIQIFGLFTIIFHFEFKIKKKIVNKD